MYDLHNQVHIIKLFWNILVFTNKMQRVPNVKEIDKNFQAFFSLSFFLKLIYLVKALIFTYLERTRL